MMLVALLVLYSIESAYGESASRWFALGLAVSAIVSIIENAWSKAKDAPQ
jgi:hypothetical protein